MRASATTAAPAARPELSETARIVGFAAVALGMFLALLDIQIVAGSLKEIQGGLSASEDEMSAIQTSYLIGEIVMIPLSGWLAKVFSTRWLFTASAASFTVSSLMCGLAWNIESMVAARVVQGFVGGAMIPLAFSVGFALFTGRKAALIPAVLGVMGTLAPTLGPVVGGWITDTFTWRSLFYLNIVPGLAICVAAPLFVRVDEPDLSRLKGFDALTIPFIALALGCLGYVLDIEHAVTRTVRDCAALLDATHGPVPGDLFVIPGPERPFLNEVGAAPRRLRIAVTTRAWSGVPVDPQVAESVRRVARLCEAMGHDVEEAAPRIDSEAFDVANLAFWCASTAFAVRRIAAATGRRPGPDTLEPQTLACYEHGLSLGAADLFAAEGEINHACRRTAELFSAFDLLLTPTLAQPTARLGAFDAAAARGCARAWSDAIFAYAPFTALFNATGQPALSLPLGEDEAGLPVGVQFVSRFGDEATLIRLASRLEEARPWAGRRPPIWAGNR